MPGVQTEIETQDFNLEPNVQEYFMGYGRGAALAVRDRSEEAWTDQEKLSEDLNLAGTSRSVEQERKSLWSLVGSVVLGAALGPIGIPLGIAAGKAIGGLGTYRGKDVEDYMVSEDVGMWDQDQVYARKDINRQLRAEDKRDFMGDVVDIGKGALLAYSMGGGKLSDPSDFSFTQFGGKKAAAEGMYGQGLFGNIDPMADVGSGSAGTLWGRFRGLTNPWDKAGSANINVDVLGTPGIQKTGVDLLEADVSDIFQQSLDAEAGWM
jgi:hypothetical protein